MGEKTRYNDYVDVEALYDATTTYGTELKEPLTIAAKGVAKYNSLATLVTKKMESQIVVSEDILINRDNVLRSSVKKIFYLNDLIKELTGNCLINKKINRTDAAQCIDLLDSFWFALCDVADRKTRELMA